MTDKIKVLPEDLTNKIAAGEVIDRPASVVKELVENSIDSGANELTVVIKDGGKGLIQVVDNGSGMSESDLLLAFQRHATSKISSYEDLVHIGTLGFRGEALASIASVARVEARTVRTDESGGRMLRIEGGVMSDIAGAGGRPGTSISVKNLFFNTPARRKFLRKSNTEYRQIVSVLNRFCIAYPEVAFTLVNEGEAIYELKKQSLEDRIQATLGPRIRKNLIPIENEGHLKIAGFTGNQDAARSSRGDQYLFFNRRYFTNKSLNYAVVSAYHDIIPKGSYPAYIVFIEMDPDQADVNVHPTKMEIKFANDSLVFSAVRGAVKRALSSHDVIPDLTPQLDFGERSNKSLFGPARRNHGVPHTPYQPAETWPDRGLFTQPDSDVDEPEELFAEEAQRRPAAFERTNVWQVHNKYIISQIKNGLILIDQHVAHERILYEKALSQFEKRKPSSQQLLFPQIIELSAEDYSQLLEILPFLEHVGFVIKEFSKNTVVIEGVPSGVKIGDDEKVLLSILDEYKRGKRDNLEIRDNIAKSYACHSAIRAGEPLTLEAMNSLIDQLFSTNEPYFCPHGRPVIINLTLDELDRRFRRH
jgi:DNA mismatch repair protein MutL